MPTLLCSVALFAAAPTWTQLWVRNPGGVAARRLDRCAGVSPTVQLYAAREAPQAVGVGGPRFSAAAATPELPAAGRLPVGWSAHDGGPHRYSVAPRRPGRGHVLVGGSCGASGLDGSVVRSAADQRGPTGGGGGGARGPACVRDSRCWSKFLKKGPPEVGQEVGQLGPNLGQGEPRQLLRAGSPAPGAHEVVEVLAEEVPPGDRRLGAGGRIPDVLHDRAAAPSA